MLSPINYDLPRMWLDTQEWSGQAGNQDWKQTNDAGKTQDGCNFLNAYYFSWVDKYILY